MDKKNTVIVIAGPTAAGKTAFAIQLARCLDTQIISADSRQCYKELTIGVAKPEVEELKAVTHYFINSHSIQEEVNAGTFEQYALNAANTIFQHHPIAVMVGGTGLYIKAFCEGMDFMPKVEDNIREDIISRYKTGGMQWLQKELQEKDPVFWQSAEQQNPHRLMRALEVFYQTGKSILAFRQNIPAHRPFHCIKIGLELPKEELYQRINTRVDRMMEAGLLEEVKSLTAFRSLNALQTVGYKELFNYLEGNCSLAEAVNDIKKNTRHYAKRQMTWFKKDGSFHWFNAATVTPEEATRVMN
jgi:tRNA dimethylallyltransferase